MNSEIIMYQTDDGLTKIETTFDGDTVWLSIDQMAERSILVCGITEKLLVLIMLTL